MRKYNNVARWSVIEKSQQPFLFNAKKSRDIIVSRVPTRRAASILNTLPGKADPSLFV